MKIITTLFLIFGINLACMGSQAGGIHPDLEDFKELVSAIVKVKVNGFEKQDVTKVTHCKSKQNKKDFGVETQYNSDNFKRVIFDVSLIETLLKFNPDKFDEKKLEKITFTEPFFNHSYVILPSGKKKDVMHTLGFEYSSSGKEFTDQICQGGNIIFLFLQDDGTGKMSIVRAEPYSEEMEAKIRKLFKIGKEKKEVELLQQNKKGNFVFYVSNQSFAETPVDITVTLNGKKAVSQDFEVGNQHNWKKHTFKLAPGKYKLVAESKKGKAKFEKELEIKDKKTWAAMDYWYYPKKDGKRFFTIHIQNNPIRFE